MSLTPRSTPLSSVTSTLVALAVTLLAATVFLWLGGTSPSGALRAFFLGPFASSLAWGNTLNQMLLLVLTGLAAAIAFGAGAFNLGGEGQIYSGGLAALGLALVLPPAWGGLGLLLCLTAGVGTGALLAGASGALKARWNADELITTFLISAAVIPLTDALLASSWLRDPASFLIMSKHAPAAFWFPPLLPPSNLHCGVLLALPLVLIFGVLINATPWGYRLQLLGRNRAFAQYAGISLARYSLLPLGLSGALHGLAGALGVLGTQHALVQNFSAGWGWNGIAVALIARSNPWAVLPAAALLAYLDQASRAVVLQGQYPFQLSALFQAAILFFITAKLARPGWLRRSRQ